MVVLVGGSRGIGQATTLLLRQQGYSVLTADRSPAAQLHVDLSSVESVQRFCDQVKQLASVAALIYNAACCLPPKLTADGFDQTAQVNLISCILISQLLRDKVQRFVYVITHPRLLHLFRMTPVRLVGYSGPQLFQYFRSKTELLALQAFLTQGGVTVSTVYPGMVSTELSNSLPAMLKYASRAIASIFGCTVQEAAATVAQAVKEDKEHVRRPPGKQRVGTSSLCGPSSSTLEAIVTQLLHQQFLANWSGNLACMCSELISPRNLDELRCEVLTACEQHKQVRFIGSQYSQSPLWVTSNQRPTVTISLAKMNKLVSLAHPNSEDAEASSAVTVQAGATLTEVDNILRARRCSLRCFGGVAGQTVAGAIATGTHGFGLDSCVSATVRSMQLVDSTGEVRDVPGKHAVHLGSLGAVFQVTMDVAPLYWITTNVSSASEIVLSELDENTLYSWFPCVHRVVVTRHRIHLDDPRIATFTKLYASVFNEAKCWIAYLLIGSWWLPLCLRFLLLHAFFIVLKVGSVCGVMRYTGLPREQLTHRFMAPVVNDVEFSFTKKQFKIVLQKLLQSFFQTDLAKAAAINFRVAREDGCCLSMSSGRASVFVSLMFMPNDVQLATNLEQLFREAGGRPHWGKWSSGSNKGSKSFVPAWSQGQFDDFNDLKERFDPRDAFYNI